TAVVLLQTRNRPTVARKNGWRCFATGFPSDTVAELNNVRDLS
ncbi:Os03g0801300, partial [Oryza sativa Japonica Group]